MIDIGWIDFTNEDRKKTLTILQTLRDEGAVDELGIGVIRDAFADYFFPGTSTLHTRAKYLLLVPYIVSDVLNKRKGKEWERLLDIIDKKEEECARKMCDKYGENEGIIGQDALRQGTWVQRAPSDIYWNGIRTFKIFDSGDERLSLKNYVKKYCESKAKDSTNPGCSGDDECGTDDDFENGNYEDVKNFPVFDIEDVYSDDWEETLNIALTRAEAEFLRRKIGESVPNSLMNFVLENEIRMDFGNEEPFRQLYHCVGKKVSADLASKMKLASDFNYLVYAARVFFNEMLGKNDQASSRWEGINNSDYAKKVECVDIEAIKNLPIMSGKKEETFNFLNEFKNLFLEGNVKSLKEKMLKREIDIKGEKRSKLLHPELVEEGSWVGGYELDYRMPDAARVLNDIMDA